MNFAGITATLVLAMLVMAGVGEARRVKRSAKKQ